MTKPSKPATASAEPNTQIGRRKDDHLTVAAKDDILHLSRGGFERYRLRHRALPGRDLAEVDASVEVFGRRLAAPLLIASMTGGTERAQIGRAHV